MKTVVVFAGKGGVGKTTATRELAVAASMNGRSVAMLDMDPQAGLTGWFARRAADTPIMLKMPQGHRIAALADSGVDELIVDMPPGIPSYVATLIAQADAVLVPCRPSPDDLASAAGIVDIMAGHPSWAFLLNQVLPRSRLTDGALRQLAAIGRVAPVSLGYRQDFPVAAIDGLAAVEFSSTKSAEEVKELRSYVDKLVGFGNGAKANR